MKKFISDNMWWMVIAAIAIGAFALYKIYHNDDEVVVTETAA